MFDLVRNRHAKVARVSFGVDVTFLPDQSYPEGGISYISKQKKVHDPCPCVLSKYKFGLKLLLQEGLL